MCIAGDMRRTVKELFEGADVDRSGILDKEEFALLVNKANKDSHLPMVGVAAADGASPGALSHLACARRCCHLAGG